MADLFQTIQERSSIRAYTKEALTNSEIELLVKAGLQAPTARNEREIHISVAPADSAVVAEIQKALNPNASTTFYYDAPVLFFLSGKDDFKWSSLDAGIAVENMHLAAKGMGLGSLIIGCVDGVLTGEQKAYFDQKLGVPEGYSFRIAFCAGHPDTTKEPHTIDLAKDVNYVK